MSSKQLGTGLNVRTSSVAWIKDWVAAPDVLQLWNQASIGVTNSSLFTIQDHQRFVRPESQEQLEKLWRHARSSE
jgi:hypothetical protein